MANDTSSLAQAMERIIGAPAGDTPQAGDVVSMAPKTPYSQELSTETPATAIKIGNTPFDPFAKQAAELAALNTQISGGTTGTTAVTGNPWDQPAVAATTPKGFFYDPGTSQVQVGGMWGAPDKMTVVSPGNINDPGVYRTMDWAIGTRKSAGFGESDPATAAALKLYSMAAPTTQKQAFENYGKYYYGAPGQTGGPGATPAAAGGQAAANAADRLRTVSRDAGGKPINPGPRAPWQASQQYWKDLASYKQAGGA